MMSEASKHTPGRLPAGYTAVAVVPASADAAAQPLRVCVLVRETADPVAGHLVLLREMLDAKAYLGCIVDASDQVQRWVEVWVQDPAIAQRQDLPGHQALAPDALDERWRGYVEAFDALEPGSIVWTGIENRHPPATFLDIKARASVAGEAVQPPPRPDLVPFNPAGGYLLVRSYQPLTADAYADLVGGAPWTGVAHGRSSIDPLNLAAELRRPGRSDAADGRLVLTHEGPTGRIAEALHLKLRLLAGATEAVRDMVERSRRPLLNLAPESLGVALEAASTGLPFLWTARVVLGMPGDAVVLRIPGSDAEFYLPGQRHRAPIYRPPVGTYAMGRGSARVPRIHVDPCGMTVLEITFTTQERVNPAPNDLVRLRFNLGEGDLDVHGRIDRDASVAPGEWRFRTVPQQLDARILSALRASEGSEMPGVTFEVVPLLSTPCDLYALGVLAVRAMLVNPSVTLPVALDKVLSLGRTVAEAGDRSAPLGRRIADFLEADRDAKWLSVLGPQQLMHEPPPLQEALDAVPLSLWGDVLAAVLRMFPGLTPESVCRDYGDAPPQALHRVFDASLDELDGLLRRTRSLLVVDWRLNREVRAIIGRQLARMAPATPAQRAPAARV